MEEEEMNLIPSLQGSIEPSTPALIGHSVSNVVPVVAANRVGVEGEMSFHGWERASAKTLAAVFGVSVQRIASIVKEN
jgi:predicted amidohydrolase